MREGRFRQILISYMNLLGYTIIHEEPISFQKR